MDGLKVIIIEKDTGDMNSLNNLLSRNCPSIQIVGVANNEKEVYKTLLTTTFDLVFVDIDMETDNVSDFLKKISGYLLNKGLVILSKSTKHAFESFKYSAIDYILKPISLQDVFKTLKKAERLKDESKIEKIFTGRPLTIVAIPSLTEVKILRTNDIIYLQSDGRYTVFYTTHQDEKIVSSKNLGYYENLLAMNENFFRIHHSYLVNIDLALNVYKKDGAYLEIFNKKYLPISKRKTDAFYKFLGI